MATVKLGMDDERFDRFRPDLEAVPSLDLNWNHGLNEEPRNFGLFYLSSIGNTGHRYVAACVIPGLTPDRYPIAVVNEEGYTIEVFASSVANWLPCYVIRLAADYLAPRRVRPGWLDREIRRLLADEAPLRAALETFAAPDVLTPILAALRAGPGADIAALYTAVEPDGYVSAFHRARASDDDLDALIRAYPFYNRPLFERLDRPEWAHEVFLRRFSQDGDGTAECLDNAAHLLLQEAYPIAAPLEPLVRQVAAEGTPEFLVGEAYHETGRRWEEAGNPAAALICYENAVHEHGLETDEWQEPALARIRDLTRDDEHYAHYLETV